MRNTLLFGTALALGAHACNPYSPVSVPDTDTDMGATETAASTTEPVSADTTSADSTPPGTSTNSDSTSIGVGDSTSDATGTSTGEPGETEGRCPAGVFGASQFGAACFS